MVGINVVAAATPELKKRWGLISTGAFLLVFMMLATVNPDPWVIYVTTGVLATLAVVLLLQVNHLERVRRVVKSDESGGEHAAATDSEPTQRNAAAPPEHEPGTETST